MISSPGILFRFAARPRTSPVSAKSAPTVRTSQMSTFGPVTAVNESMWNSGHRPVAV